MSRTKKILLSGGAGYIGAHTAVVLLEQGFDVVIVDDLSRSTYELIEGIESITEKKVNFFRGDCRDVLFMEQIFLKEKIDCVIHFAAFKAVGESVQMPLLYYDNNLGSLITLLQTMEKFDVNEIIFSSSCAVYGQPDSIPVDETAPFKKAESPYGATKQMSERILEDAAAANARLKVISLRYFNPIGAHPSSKIGELPIGVPGNLVPFVTQTAAGLREKLVIFGNDYDTIDGTCVRDFIHVVDLAEGHVQAIRKIAEVPHRYEVFNLGTGDGVSVLELITAFINETGVPLKYEIGPRRVGDVVKVYADPSKAKKWLGWSSQLTLQQGLRDAWNWQQKIK